MKTVDGKIYLETSSIDVIWCGDFANNGSLLANQVLFEVKKKTMAQIEVNNLCPKVMMIIENNRVRQRRL